MRSIAVFLILFAALATTASHADYIGTTLDNPAAVNTYLSGIDGTNMVGSYTDSSYNYHGTHYDGSTWTTLDYGGVTATH